MENIIINNPVRTEEDLFNTLVIGGMPKKVAEDISLVFNDIAGLRKIVESDDYAALKIVSGIGDKRAEKICTILKGRIPSALANIAIQIPDVRMFEIPNLNLAYEDGKAKLSSYKWKNGKKIMKNNAPVKDVASKRHGPILQKLAEIEGTDEQIVFTTISEIPVDYRDPVKELEMKAYWWNRTHYGIKMPDGEIWIPGMMGTNSKMKCQIHWIRLKSKAALDKWMRCGANFNSKKVNIAKMEAYFGLLLPYTKELLCNRLDPTMETLTTEWNNEHKGENVLIHPDGKMEKKESYFVNEFDGQLHIELTEELIKKMGLNRRDLRQLKRAIAKFNGGTIRGPWHKGVIVVGFGIHEALRKAGVTTIGGKPIEDIAMFGDKSVFKAAVGEGELYEKFEDFCTAFTELKHRFGVLLENHGIKKTFLPAQQLQAAHGCDPKFIEEGAKAEVEYLNAAKDPKVAAARYTPNIIARIANDDPTIMTTWFAKDMAKTGYNKEYKSSLAGRTHGENRTGLVIKDLKAYVEWIAYCEGVRKELPEGCLQAYDVYAPEAGLTGEAVASRNPVIANYGLPVVNVINSVGEYDEFFDEGFGYIMVGIHDDLCKRLRMDHDGDKIRLTFDKWFVDAVKSINVSGVFAEWESFGEVVKEFLTDETEKEFWSSCTTTPTLGLNVDACSKMIANGIITKEVYEFIMDYMMNKGTDVKQGADGSNVGGEAGELWREMKKLIEKAKISIAMAYGKMEKGRTVEELSKEVASEYGNSNLDIISRAVRKDAITALKYDGKFDVRKVLIKGRYYIHGLVGSGTKENDYKDPGLFNSLVSMSKNEFAQMDDRAKSTGFDEYLEMRKAFAMKKFKEFAEVHGITMADVYDCITTYIFEYLADKFNGQNTSENGRKWYIVLARTYLQWFGDMIYDTYCTNEDMGFLPAVDQAMELEESIW